MWPTEGCLGPHTRCCCCRCCRLLFFPWGWCFGVSFPLLSLLVHAVVRTTVPRRLVFLSHAGQGVVCLPVSMAGNQVFVHFLPRALDAFTQGPSVLCVWGAGMEVQLRVVSGWLFVGMAAAWRAFGVDACVRRVLLAVTHSAGGLHAAAAEMRLPVLQRALVSCNNSDSVCRILQCRKCRRLALETLRKCLSCVRRSSCYNSSLLRLPLVWHVH